ncbi:MAG: maltodextrin glucosidase, partial [Lachnospiraceae bacterium]
FERRSEDECIWIALNISADEFTAHSNELQGNVNDLISNDTKKLSGSLLLPAYSIQYFRVGKD